MPLWNPPSWFGKQSDDRVRDFVDLGTQDDPAQVRDHRGRRVHAHDRRRRALRLRVVLRRVPVHGPWRDRTLARDRLRAQKVVYFPRRSFDMWNTRYFILPEFPNGWIDEFRGYAAFLHETEPVYPAAGPSPSPERRRGDPKAWIETHDFQIRRNRLQYPPRLGGPRRPRPAQDGRPASGRPVGPDAGDPLRRRPDLARRQLRPRSIPTAWSGSTTTSGWPCGPSSPARSPRSSETVKVSYPSPQRAELDAKLDTPGHRRPRRRQLPRLEAHHRRPARPHLSPSTA